ncbi:MAG: leucine-rich repeat domain-containing protein [Prevotella sp.]|nr:leucine-rich repeat domain-containing protein [Prevotella sp.]
MKKTLGVLSLMLCATPMIYAQADGIATHESSDVAMALNGAAKGKVIDSGSCGKNVNFELYDDYTLRIFGKGAMYNYNYIYTTQRMYSDTPWSSWDSKIKSVVIEDGVTRIGANAFFCSTSLTEVNIPNTVTSIGRAAFQNCTALKKIDIPNSVTSIGAYAFAECSSLAEVNIPDGLETIDEGVFDQCSSLAQIEIPNSVTSIGRFAFSQSSLTEIIIPDGVTSIGQGAFGWCDNLKYVKIGKGVTVIADGAFFNDYTNRKIEIEIAAETHVTLLDVMVIYYDRYEPDSSNAFGFSNNNPEDITIRVPETMLDDYRNSEEWSYYKEQLYGLGSTDIRSVGEGQLAMKADMVYDLQGRRVTEMQPDRIYIVNGKKVVNNKK